MKRKILHIAQAAGGVERFLFTLLKNLDQKEFDNILICSQNYSLEKFEGLVSDAVVLPMERNINLFKEIKTIFTIRKLIKTYSPDIVYLHSSKAGANGRIANIGLKNYCIYNAHGWSFNMQCGSLKKKIYTTIERVLSPLTDKIVAISEYEKNTAIERKICKENKINVIYNGVEEYVSAQNAMHFDLGIPDGAFVVGFVGRISSQKAPDVFIKAASIIKKKIPNAYFIIVGDGEDKSKIMSLIFDLELSDSTLITGWVKEPNEYIKRFDVAMLLSRWEGFGLVLTEYMRERKPVVATKADAIPEIIHDGVNGLLVNIDDYVAAAAMVIKLHDDPVLAGKMAESGSQILKEKFLSGRFIKEHTDLFKTCK